MKRRDFLTNSALMIGAGLAAPHIHQPLGFEGQEQTTEAGRVMTVTGAVAPEALGITLPHEHILVDFIGADQVGPDRYDVGEVFEAVLPYLLQARDLGCQTLCECTPAYLGRDPVLLARLSRASGLLLLTNTGYYGAADDKYVPGHAREETADQLAARWVREWEEGVAGTGIRPGFIKTGVDGGPLSKLDTKLVRAAARAHLRTGLTIAAHTGDGIAAHEELAILHEEGVAGSAWIWVHAQNEEDVDLHARAAEQGAWIEFDGIGPDSMDKHLAFVTEMKRRGYLQQVLISQDAGWYSPGEPGGGPFRSFDTLFTAFVPILRKAGFSPPEVRQLMIENPQRAFVNRLRARD